MIRVYFECWVELNDDGNEFCFVYELEFLKVGLVDGVVVD